MLTLNPQLHVPSWKFIHALADKFDRAVVDVSSNRLSLAAEGESGTSSCAQVLSGKDKEMVAIFSEVKVA